MSRMNGKKTHTHTHTHTLLIGNYTNPTRSGTAMVPSYLWLLRIFRSHPGSRVLIISRCKFSTLTSRQLMVECYLLTLSATGGRIKELILSRIRIELTTPLGRRCRAIWTNNHWILLRLTLRSFYQLLLLSYSSH